MVVIEHLIEPSYIKPLEAISRNYGRQLLEKSRELNYLKRRYQRSPSHRAESPNDLSTIHFQHAQTDRIL